MKFLLFFITNVLFFGNFVSAGKVHALPTTLQIPDVVILYASNFDKVCTSKTSYKIESSWVQDLKNNLPTWIDVWHKEGAPLLDTSAKLVGKAFNQKNFHVSLSLCSFPSMSTPLIVNARYALHDFTPHPISNSVFISIIYHEILHNYIDSFLPKKTPLLIKYKNEPQDVLSHLHLLALEKAVYLQLGREHTLKQVIEKDENLPNKDYKRAWKIINKKEVFENFIAELKSYSSNINS